MADYLTAAEATTLLTKIPFTSIWAPATTATKEAAIHMATIIINKFTYKGIKTDEDQLNEFPRNEATAVPTDVLTACALIACKIVDGYDTEMEIEAASLASTGFANVKSSYREEVPLYKRFGVPSPTAWQLLVQYLDLSNTATLIRVN